MSCSWLFGSIATGAVTMSAVARDSPQMMGEAADTPRCPVLQRDWLGEGQLSSLTRQKSEGVELGPLWHYHYRPVLESGSTQRGL